MTGYKCDLADGKTKDFIFNIYGLDDVKFTINVKSNISIFNERICVN